MGGIMKKLTYKFLVSAFLILYLGAFAGGILAGKIVGEKSGNQFLMLAFAVSSLLFGAKILIYAKAKNSLFYNFIFVGGITVDLAWLLYCFILPLFWLPEFRIFQKFCVLTVYMNICVGNILLAFKTFDEKWESSGRLKFDEMSELNKDFVDWEKISKSMMLEAILFIPGVPLKFGNAISVILVALAFLGLALRGMFPMLSMFALVLPFSMAAACCLQISSYGFALARKVKSIEGGEEY